MFNAKVYDASATGSPVAADFNGPPFNYKGGRIVLGAFGTFGGGSAKLQYTTDNDTTWVDLGPQNGVATALTAAGTSALFLPPIRLRFSLLGSTAPSLAYWVGDAGGM